MKRITSLFLIAIIMLTLLCGCVNNNNDGKIKIVTTYFAAYDWTRNILGDKSNNFELILISDNGVDMHSYQPTADDVIDIKTADIIIYNDSNSQKWIADTINKKDNTSAIVINSISVLESRLLHIGENADHNAHSHGKNDIDEHIWLSLENSVLMCKKIKESLCKVDKENASIYTENFEKYKTKINALDTEYKEKFKNLKCDTLIFADRFPFRYTLYDYSLEYSALFEGCNSQSDATIDSILSLSKKIDNTSSKYIFIIDDTAVKTAKSVIDNTNFKSAKILTADSMQTVTKENLSKSNYIKIMQNNLSLFYKALK